MHTPPPPLTLADIAGRLGGEIVGDDAIAIKGASSLDDAGEGEIAFFDHPRFRAQLKKTQAAAVIVRRGESDCTSRPRIVVDESPRFYLAKLLGLLFPPQSPAPGVHPSAVVEEGAQVAESAHIGAFAYIAAGAKIGERAKVGAHSSVGGGAIVGDDCELKSHATLYPQTVVGEKTIIHSGAVVGADGFGYEDVGGRREKIPQIGRAVIGSRAEIGANTAIDRGALGDTIIGDGVKIDNLVQIGHNVVVGDDTVICGCCGIAGSVIIGSHCTLGGAVKVADHVRIADNVTVLGGASVTGDILESGAMMSSTFPPLPAADWRRWVAQLRRLGGAPGRHSSQRGIQMTDNTPPPPPYDIQEVMRRLPHRYPFLLIDRVLSCEPGKSLVAIKNVSVNEPFFQGHFPGRPIMPGVLILEMCAQACGLLSIISAGAETTSNCLLAGIGETRFRRMVTPGDRLTVHAELGRAIRSIHKCRARVEVEGEIVCETEILNAFPAKS